MSIKYYDMKVAILIPTLNRPEFVKRTVLYYDSLKSNHPIYIGDASDANISRKTLSFLKGINNVSFKYFHWEGLGIAQTLGELAKEASDLGMSDDINDVAGVTPGMLIALGKNEIKTRDDLADLAGDELIEILEAGGMAGALNEEQANDVIMAARAHWFADDPAPEKETDEQAEEVVEDDVQAAEDGDA